MFVRFTPGLAGLHLEIDPQDLDPANQPMPTFEIDLPFEWQVDQQQDVFVVLFPEIQIEIDANDVLNIWELVDNIPHEPALYSTPIISPQLAEEVKQQFLEGMPDFEVTYSRFRENDEMNNASTVTVNGYASNRSNQTNPNNASMSGGKKRRRKSRKARRHKKRTVRSGRTRKAN